ncbi:MAG: phosphosulfolactate synthase, partial [Bacteroidota bacterium]
MNYELNNLPERTEKPRESGYTMAMDKGMSLRETEDFLDVASSHVDIVKMGWATSFVTPKLEEKIKIFKDAGIPCYFGGTLFEAFVIRNQFEDYLRVLDKFKLTHAEVSDGSIDMEHDDKCKYIERVAKQAVVLSEVGSKDADKIIPPYK